MSKLCEERRVRWTRSSMPGVRRHSVSDSHCEQDDYYYHCTKPPTNPKGQPASRDMTRQKQMAKSKRATTIRPVPSSGLAPHQDNQATATAAQQQQQQQHHDTNDEFLAIRVASHVRAVVQDLHAYLEAARQPNRERALSAEIDRHAIEELVGKTFDSIQNGLSDWIDPRSYMGEKINSRLRTLRGHLLHTPNGNAFRSDFEQLIKSVASYIGPDHDITHWSGKDAEDWLFTLSKSLPGPDADTIAKRLSWACFGVRTIGNDRSHVPTRAERPASVLGDDEIRDLCACMRSLAIVVPQLAVYTTPLPVPAPRVTHSVATSTSPSPPLSPRAVAGEDDDDGSETDISSIDGYASSTAPSPPPSRQLSPTKNTHGGAMLRYFTAEKRHPLRTERQRLQIEHLKSHTKSLRKAVLCTGAHSTRTVCPHSHSLFEVMSVSPLYKLFVCDQDDHYTTPGTPGEVVERADCPFLHVDVGFSTEWMEIDGQGGKLAFCSLGAECAKRECLRSHSFEDRCWFNPNFKTESCKNGCRTKESCAASDKYHPGTGDKRFVGETKDYVGKDAKILKIKRTHGTLIDKLQSLGLM